MDDDVWRVQIDNKLENIEKDAKGLKEEMKKDNDEIKSDIAALDKKFDDYTHVYQFIPVRNIAYGLVTSFGIGIVGALIAVITTSGVPSP